MYGMVDAGRKRNTEYIKSDAKKRIENTKKYVVEAENIE